jgi:hypothetical protein
MQSPLLNTFCKRFMATVVDILAHSGEEERISMNLRGVSFRYRLMVTAVVILTHFGEEERVSMIPRRVLFMSPRLDSTLYDRAWYPHDQ